MEQLTFDISKGYNKILSDIPDKVERKKSN